MAVGAENFLPLQHVDFLFYVIRFELFDANIMVFGIRP